METIWYSMLRLTALLISEVSLLAVFGKGKPDSQILNNLQIKLYTMHFFIDFNELGAQIETGPDTDMKFGPDPTTPTTKFNITSQFKLSNVSKAFACQKGMMIVQRNDSNTTGLVNIIIKPDKATKLNGLAVKYYVYRGIKLDSFMSESGGTYTLLPESTTNKSDFLTEFWTNETDRSNDDPNYTAPTPLNLGYGADTLPLTNPDNLNEDRSIDDFFNNKCTAKPISVEEGLWIGNFDNVAKIGFDIILENDLSIPSEVKHYRAATRSISIGSETGLELRKLKDSILAFIDPAAFFGLHYRDKVTGVDSTTYSSGSKATGNKTTPGSLYTDVLSKFSNKNRVYLDIRSEKGLSYNFYDTYKISGTNSNNLRVDGADEAGATEFKTSGWPIKYFDTALQTGTKKNHIKLRLRLDGNTKPVFYLDNKDDSYHKDGHRNRTHFFSGSKSLEDGETDWTAEVKLYYPHDSTGAKNNIAYVVKVHYFLEDPINTATRLENQKYFNSPFCSVNLGEIGDAAITNGWVENPTPQFIKEKLQTDGTGNFAHVARAGAYWDTQKVLFYAAALKPEIRNSGKKYMNTYSKKLSMTNTKYDKLKNSFETIVRQYQRVDGSTNVDFNIVGINDYKVKNIHQNKEDLLLLGLIPTEFTTVKGTAGLSDHHPKYIFLEPDSSNPLYDNTTKHHRYHKYTIWLQGLNASGTPHKVTTGVVVYSRDNTFFSSEAFSALETLSLGFPGLTEPEKNRIEFHMFHDGVVKLNDNIDLALVRKSTYDTEHTVVDDNAITGDTSLVQKIKYIYYNATNTATELAEFNIVMANKMARSKATSGGVVSSIEQPEYTQSMTFSSGSAKRSFSNAAGDIKTVNHATLTTTSGSRKVRWYRNQGKKIFMVHFITPLTVSDTNSKNIFNSTNNTEGIVFTYSATRRRFARPDFAAAVLGALVNTDVSITTTGFSFGDATCYPSTEHVNGEAIDTTYKGGAYRSTTNNAGTIVVSQADPGTATTNGQDKDFIVELRKYGIDFFRIGKHKAGLKTLLDAETTLSGKIKQDGYKKVGGVTNTVKHTLHDNHLHSAKIKLTDGVKTVPQ